MPFYRLTARANGATLDVKANRPSCARGAAARLAQGIVIPGGGVLSPRTWRDPELSSVEQINASEYRSGYRTNEAPQ